MQKKIAITLIDHYRRVQPVANIKRWALLNNIPAVTIPEKDMDQTIWEDVGALYIPLTLNLNWLARVPCQIPIILDYDGCLGGNLSGDHYLKKHRFAFRRAFGGKMKYRPEFQVPYLHLPIAIPKSDERDIIIFDVHNWLPISSQFSFLSIMSVLGASYSQICVWANCRIKFYLTSFVPINPYFDAADKFIIKMQEYYRNLVLKANPLIPFLENLVPPAKEVAAYHELIGRARLFITDHVDLADQDLIHAGSVGTPIYPISRNPLSLSMPIGFTLADSVTLIEPRFKDVLDQAKEQCVKLESNFKHVIQIEKNTPWDSSTLESAFFKSWDLLWDWALEGHIEKNVNRAVINSPQWKPNF